MSKDRCPLRGETDKWPYEGQCTLQAGHPGGIHWTERGGKFYTWSALNLDKVLTLGLAAGLDFRD